MIPTDFSYFIPSIHSQPVKFLGGRIIDGSLSDTKSISGLEKKLLSGLKVIDRCHFKGTQTLWIQHLLVCRIQWPLIIYKTSISAASNLEKKISTYIRKWLGLHSSTTNISIYSFCSSYPLPVKKNSLLHSSHQHQVGIFYLEIHKIS